MSTVLRAYGADFDVDAFLVSCTLPVCAIKRRGEPVFPASQANGRRHDRSGVHVVVSDAGFDEFPRQVEEAVAFLQANAEQVRRFCDFPGIDGVTLDFGIARRDVAVQSDRLPAELIRLAPTFAVEVRSENDYGPAAEAEMAAKRDDYFAAGTQIVWDVDPEAETVACYRAVDPANSVVFRRGDMAVAEPAVPGWSMAVDDIFAE